MDSSSFSKSEVVKLKRAVGPYGLGFTNKAVRSVYHTLTIQLYPLALALGGYD
jgi:hypothetical protein